MAHCCILYPETSWGQHRSAKVPASKQLVKHISPIISEHTQKRRNENSRIKSPMIGIKVHQICLTTDRTVKEPETLKTDQ